MSKIEATIIKHSKCPRGHELVTYELVFPRFLLAELNTHRMFSKNSASSRAIPFKKMVEMVKTNPFVPIAWQKEHKGMQGNMYLEVEYSELARQNWLLARDKAVEEALRLSARDVTKQLCNRLLEPFMWHKVVLTTGLEGLRNFFELRCPDYVFNDEDKDFHFKSKKDAIKYFKEDEVVEYETGDVKLKDLTTLQWLGVNKGQAEIHMMELAEQMYDAYNESVPQKLKAGEYHVPYDEELLDLAAKCAGEGFSYMDIIKASTGKCARTSYLTVGDDKSPSIETLVGIHDKMVNAVPKHSSPMEHIAKVMTDEEYYLFSKGMDGQKDHEHGWCLNYRGFMQYRYILEQRN
jgi:hypothetical protein